MQFNSERQEMFKEVTAKAINEYCLSNTKCELVDSNQRYELQGYCHLIYTSLDYLSL